MKNYIILILLFLAYIFCGCSTKKYIMKGNVVFKLKEREPGSRTYEITKNKLKKCIRAEIIDKGDYLVIIPDDDEFIIDTSLEIRQEEIDITYGSLIEKMYYPELKRDEYNTHPLKYFDIKFGLQALTVPLKFRKGIGDPAINPPTIETGVNIGFAPGWKFSNNIYKQSKNYLGKNTTQIAIAVGPHFGLGATDLKKTSNAPGLLSDRKAPIFTVGGYLLLGLNNINIGFAFGKDYVLGEGKKNWIYQGKCWPGVIVSLDVLKF